MFSEAILDHFRKPRNVGNLPDATASVEATNPACGDVLQLFVRVRDERIDEARFLCRGCTTSIACASWLTEKLHGLTAEEARGIGVGTIANALGGLPPATVHGAQLAVDALGALLSKIKST